MRDEAIAQFRAMGLRTKKAFGQNFLTDPSICEQIAALALPEKSGTVIEIGPGLGALTEPLLNQGADVVAIEKDRDLAAILRKTFEPVLTEKRLELIEGDATKQNWPALIQNKKSPHVLTGNVPYSVTGMLVEQATRYAPEFIRTVFMVQKEVADRLCADPDTSDYGALTVFVQAQFLVERAFIVRAHHFFPRPEVDSAVVVMNRRSEPISAETQAFREIVKRAFSQRRKTLRNAWKGIFNWPSTELESHAAQCSISLDARGETLSVEQFANLAKLAGSKLANLLV